jgi:hypothetical protein
LTILPRYLRKINSNLMNKLQRCAAGGGGTKN